MEGGREKTEAPVPVWGGAAWRGLRGGLREKAAGPPHQTLEPERAGRGWAGPAGLGKESGAAGAQYSGKPRGKSAPGGGVAGTGWSLGVPRRPRRHRTRFLLQRSLPLLGGWVCSFPSPACRPGCCVCDGCPDQLLQVSGERGVVRTPRLPDQFAGTQALFGGMST